MIFLWLALVLLILSFLTRKFLCKSSQYPFMSTEKTDIPYITINIQGQDFNMITDSGASVSIIRRDAISNLEYEKSVRAVNLTSITNDGVDSNVIVLPVNVNGKEIKTDFVIYDGDDIADFSRKYGITIHGILGIEFFKLSKGKVDFKTQTVTFP